MFFSFFAPFFMIIHITRRLLTLAKSKRPILYIWMRLTAHSAEVLHEVTMTPHKQEEHALSLTMSVISAA
jgi:hypothetical protein